MSARRAASGPHLAIVFVCLLVGAWTIANPPGYTPDEPAHYTKAIGVGNGDWVGAPGAYPVGPGFGPEQLRWINKVARAVDLPPNLASDSFACSVFQPYATAECLDKVPPPDVPVKRLTYVGTYEPFLYLAPGLVMNQADDAFTALTLGRSVSGAMALALLVAAIGVLWKRGEEGYPLLGLVVAVTPMVIFLMSGLGPSGPEIAAQVCLTSVLLRLARPQAPPPLVWVALAASGAVLSLSRALGPFFLAADVALLLALLGPRGAFQVFRRGGRAALAAVGVVLLGVAANIAWAVAVQPDPGLDLQVVLSWVGRSVREVPGVLRQDVGAFGWADVTMPSLAYVVWGAMVAALVILAFLVGQRRQRVVLALVIVGCFVGTVVVAAAVIHPYAFPMYGRYALPLWVTVPLCAGETILLNRGRLPSLLRRGLIPAVSLLAAGVHFTAFYVNARRYAVGDRGPVLFVGQSKWSPFVGWSLWVGVVAVAALALVAYGVLASSTSVSDGQSGHGRHRARSLSTSRSAGQGWRRRSDRARPSSSTLRARG